MLRGERAMILCCCNAVLGCNTTVLRFVDGTRQSVAVVSLSMPVSVDVMVCGFSCNQSVPMLWFLRLVGIDVIPSADGGCQCYDFWSQSALMFWFLGSVGVDAILSWVSQCRFYGF